VSEEGVNASEPKRVPEKRCQPFSMIPLEPWNVEREGHFSSKRMNEKDGTAHHPLSYSLFGTEVKTTCHRPLWNAGTWNASVTSAVKVQRRRMVQPFVRPLIRCVERTGTLERGTRV
jgi:hypothetical protein